MDGSQREKNDEQVLKPLLPRHNGHRQFPRSGIVGTETKFLLAGLLCFLFYGFIALFAWHDDVSTAALTKCAWNTLEPHASLLSVPSIDRAEFLARQATLAEALAAAGIDAFVAEPSASSAYYANISAAFDLSERPFLVIIDRRGGFSYLVPQFESGRIAGLGMVYDGRRRAIAWAEEESPYEIFARETGFEKVMLDEHVRYMIAAGLQDAGIEIVPMSPEVQALREVKTAAEIDILRAINQFTLHLLRSLRGCIRQGVTQETVTDTARALFTQAGVGEGFWAAVLFGEQAANPHGGSHGKALGAGEFVLVDIGSQLHGYGSDVTRTMLPDGSKVSDDLTSVWETVLAAQSAGFALMHANETCAEADAASRKVITDAGYGPFYTHRLGHGLGLEMHEHPYLNGANREKLTLGEVVTNEPIYIYITGHLRDHRTGRIDREEDWLRRETRGPDIGYAGRGRAVDGTQSAVAV